MVEGEIENKELLWFIATFWSPNKNVSMGRKDVVVADALCAQLILEQRRMNELLKKLLVHLEGRSTDG